MMTPSLGLSEDVSEHLDLVLYTTVLSFNDFLKTTPLNDNNHVKDCTDRLSAAIQHDITDFENSRCRLYAPPSTPIAPNETQ